VSGAGQDVPREDGAEAAVPDEEHESVNRESHPNAGGPQGLAGDMGISSERAEGLDPAEGTGTMGSSQGRTDGESPTTRVDSPGSPAEPDPDPDKPDQTSSASEVDRTVGEVQPDEVENKHEFDPSRNPGH
jgi:hypothetical protein